MKPTTCNDEKRGGGELGQDQRERDCETVECEIGLNDARDVVDRSWLKSFGTAIPKRWCSTTLHRISQGIAALQQFGSTVIKTSLSEDDTRKLQEALQPPTPTGAAS